jgi:hypothetical protein
MQEEAGKLGWARIGSIGAIPYKDAKGREVVLGNCVRLAWLRCRGVSKKIPVDDSPLLEGGYANEMAFSKAIEPSLHARGYKLLLNLEIKDEALKVSGRPDVIITDQADNKVAGVELKCLSSYYSVETCVYKRQARMEHAAQAAAYSLMLGKLPYTLHYSSRVKYIIPSFSKKHFDQGVPFVEYNEKGEAKNTLPLEFSYPITWQGDTVFICRPGDNEPTETPITASSLYRHLAVAQDPSSDMARFSRPSTEGLFGENSYDKCMYCPFLPQCKKLDNGAMSTQEWFSAIKARDDVYIIEE